MGYDVQSGTVMVVNVIGHGRRTAGVAYIVRGPEPDMNRVTTHGIQLTDVQMAARSNIKTVPSQAMMRQGEKWCRPPGLRCAHQ